MRDLIIVESSAKAKTIKKYLGNNYDVMASVGHVRDLPVKRLGVNITKNFEPQYTIIKNKKEIIEKLKEKSSKSKVTYLATDPDREGEAISWHLAYILKLNLNEKNRITFNEITKFGIENGMNNPRKIDMSLVEAQQTRRILDRLVGYKLSPFLCKKIQKGVSAGRVQSVALKVIVERENEIRSFVEEEYWKIITELKPKDNKRTKKFESYFYGNENKKIDLKNKEEAYEILNKVKDKEFKIIKIVKGKKNRYSPPPFMTSTLQQDASRKLGFTSRRTMKAAQELYEGISIKESGLTGLITYMRTDSLRVSKEAINECREFISNNWSSKYLPKKEKIYKTKNNSQDAHEAIRPSSCKISPNSIKEDLSSDQYKLYTLIWNRFVASQMSNCIYNTVKIKIKADDYIFKASGSEVHFDGFTVLYTEGKDEKEIKENMLPDLIEGMICECKEIKAYQHFTDPPSRFTEASIIKFLEENGIGRPSTYASVISTIVYREYVTKEGKTFKPTELGEAVNLLINKYFSDIVNIKFTAQMEKNLDDIESNKEERVNLLSNFYGGFEKKLNEVIEETKDLKIKLKENETDIICEKCGKNMIVKKGRYGKFIACSGYPECKNIKKFMQTLGVDCPKCCHDLVKRTSGKGRVFYGCSSYPDCDFVSWLLPTTEKCPNCNKILYVSKKDIICQNPNCNFKDNYDIFLKNKS